MTVAKCDEELDGESEMTESDWLAEKFQEKRPHLRAVACRILGSERRRASREMPGPDLVFFFPNLSGSGSAFDTAPVQGVFPSQSNLLTAKGDLHVRFLVFSFAQASG